MNIHLSYWTFCSSSSCHHQAKMQLPFKLLLPIKIKTFGEDLLLSSISKSLSPPRLHNTSEMRVLSSLSSFSKPLPLLHFNPHDYFNLLLQVIDLVQFFLLRIKIIKFHQNLLSSTSSPLSSSFSKLLHPLLFNQLQLALQVIWKNELLTDRSAYFIFWSSYFSIVILEFVV